MDDIDTKSNVNIELACWTPPHYIPVFKHAQIIRREYFAPRYCNRSLAAAGASSVST